MSVSIAEVRAFVEALHEVPEGDQGGVPPDWRAAPPHFLPEGVRQSVALEATSCRQASARPTSPFSSLCRVLDQAYGMIGNRTYFPHVASAYFPGMAVGINKLVRPMVIPRRAVASGGATYPNDITVYIPDNARGHFAPWAGTALGYAPQYNRLCALARAPDAPAAQAGLGLGADERAVVLLVSLNLYRTYYKYRDFTFRLSAVDTGILVGRLCQLARSDWDVAVHFTMDCEALQSVIGREHESHPVYCALVLTPKAQIAASDLACPPLETHAPLGSAQDNARLLPQFSERFAAARDLARQHRQDRKLRWPAPSGMATRRAAPAVADSMPIPPLETAHRAGAHVWRRSRAQSFNGMPVAKNVLMRCLRAMWTAGRQLDSVADRPLALPGIWVSVINVTGVGAGYYRVSDDGETIEKTGVFSSPKALSDALYLKNFDMRKAGFIVHLGNVLFNSGSDPDFSDYLSRQMAAGAMLDGGMLACAEKELSAHAFLGFSSRDVEAAYQVPDDQVRMLAQLSVGAISLGIPFDVPFA